MANFIYSRVNIQPQEAMDKICGMIKSMPNVPFGQETKTIIQTFYKDNSEVLDDNSLNYTWIQNNVGTHWINLNIEDDYITINSPTIIPDGFIVKLYSLCISDFDDVEIYCKWWDETETQCGVALVKDGMYTEDEIYMDSEDIYDTSYYPSGFEDIIIVKDWVKFKLNPESSLNPDDIDNMDEDDVRDLFSDWKEEEKWITIENNWSTMFKLSQDAIKNPEIETPITKIKTIAKRKYEMIQDCYPF